MSSCFSVIVQFHSFYCVHSILLWPPLEGYNPTQAVELLQKKVELLGGKNMGSWSVECETLQSTQTFSKDGARGLYVVLRIHLTILLNYQLLLVSLINLFPILPLSSQLQEDHRNWSICCTVRSTPVQHLLSWTP